MPYTNNAVPYLECLLDHDYYAPTVDAVEAAIRENGVWEDRVEWRFATETALRIEPAEWNNQPAYKVTVSCESVMICHCPTVERAITYARIFARLQADLVWSMGWPSSPGPNSRAELAPLRADSSKTL